MKGDSSDYGKQSVLEVHSPGSVFLKGRMQQITTTEMIVMDETTSLVFYEMLVEKQRDESLNEEPGVLLKQSPPQVGDEVLIGSLRPWRVISVEQYGILSVAWIALASLPTPPAEIWCTEIRKEFFPEAALSFCLTPDLHVVEWGISDADWAENRIGERLADYEGTGQKYIVVDDIESEVMKVTPNEWVIDRYQSIAPNSPENSYTRIDLYHCQSGRVEEIA
ncbi:hypothetical protein LBWT_12210 [Leptolyngbya boryana IAM M-101]|nr:hypothetical protein LBWT_12210 [Leptolyngbya boryana IAM M-101]BAS61663.1 hypothetical protein LBDG_12210 [Leptolyngbya boryana dg5]